MKRTDLGAAFIAIGLLLIGVGCAGQRLSTAEADFSRRAERIEDPFAALPVAKDSVRQPSQSETRGPDASPVMPAFQAASDASMFLFDIPFRFDRFTLLPHARAMVEVNAMRLKESDEPAWALLLEGRCDEAGSRDYNLVLGERRAQSVREYLVNLGIPSVSIEIISYGKDRPLCTEHNELCWAKNRTVHFMVK